MNNQTAKREIIAGIIWAAAMIAVALAAQFAHRLGYLDDNAVTRIVSAAIGLWMVWFGNRIPKTVVPNAFANRARRVSAWSLVLSGLAYTGLWAFAPIPVAQWGGPGVVLAGIAVTLAYCVSLASKLKAS
jgi:hypothetical protein